MGIDDVTINSLRTSYDGSKIYLIGSGFTKWSKVYINGEKVATTYLSGRQLAISASKLADGDTVQICQVGSNNTVFRSSQEWVYEDPNAEVDTETEEMEPEEQQGEL
jgi:pSer/pThr/pTyr-binding forkhead associated (FHA) protein